MINTPRGVTTAPHRFAAQTGAEVLRDGGNAIEAMIAMAATIAVVYPHMNSIGGDGFWLDLHTRFLTHRHSGVRRGRGGSDTRVLFRARRRHDPLAWRSRRADRRRNHRGMAAGVRTQPQARRQAAAAASPRRRDPPCEEWRRGLGQPGTAHDGEARRTEECAGVPGCFLQDGKPPSRGSSFKNNPLASTFEHLARSGLMDFYRGDVARNIAADLASAGSPVTLSDLEGYGARLVAPLSVKLQGLTAFNMPPPTQGVASLLILAIHEQLASKLETKSASSTGWSNPPSRPSSSAIPASGIPPT